MPGRDPRIGQKVASGHDIIEGELVPSGQIPRPSLAIPPPGSQVLAWETLDDIPNPAAYVSVPHYDAALSAGDGAVWTEHTDNDTLLFRAKWFRAKGLKPEHCKALYVRGTSMEPTLLDGDTVMIDTAQTEPRDDTVFAVLYHGELLIKRLFRRPGGGIDLVSDNPRYQVREVTGSDLEQLIILGVKIWRAG